MCNFTLHHLSTIVLLSCLLIWTFISTQKISFIYNNFLWVSQVYLIINSLKILECGLYVFDTINWLYNKSDVLLDNAYFSNFLFGRLTLRKKKRNKSLSNIYIRCNCCSLEVQNFEEKMKVRKKTLPKQIKSIKKI